MSRSRSLPGLSRGLALLLALAACGGGGGSGRPPSEAVIRTLAYVVTECRDTKGTSSATQELRILRGEGPAVSVLRLPTFASTGGLCTFIASEFSTPPAGIFMPFGVFQRLGVSPDGARVVFEVSGAF